MLVAYYAYSDNVLIRNIRFEVKFHNLMTQSIQFSSTDFTVYIAS
jgi:hypothetical protein